MPQTEGSFVTEGGFSNYSQSFVADNWPPSVSILHLSRSEEVTAGCNTTLLLSLYRPTSIDDLDEASVSIDLQGAFPRFSVSQVSERVITMGDGIKGEGCLQTARGKAAVVMLPNSVCSFSMCLQ